MGGPSIQRVKLACALKHDAASYGCYRSRTVVAFNHPQTVENVHTFMGHLITRCSDELWCCAFEGGPTVPPLQNIGAEEALGNEQDWEVLGERPGPTPYGGDANVPPRLSRSIKTPQKHPFDQRSGRTHREARLLGAVIMMLRESAV